MRARLSIYSIIEEAIDLFKANYKLFLTLSALGALCSLAFSLINERVNSNDITNAVVLVVLLVIAIYFSVRLQIALIIAINNRFQNFETDFRECYKTAGSYFWSYILTSIALALLIGLSVVFIFLSISMESSPLVVVLFVVGFGGLALLLLYYFNFAPLVSILNPEAPSNFAKSRELVKNKPRLVISMLGLALIGQILLYLVFDTLVGDVFIFNLKISRILEFLVDLVVSPIFTIIYIMVYFQLQDDSDEEEKGVSEDSVE